MAEKKILIIVPPQQFHDEQHEICRRFWENSGHKVSVASIEKSARSDKGRTVPVDVRVKEVKTYDYDAFVFIGGEGNRILFEDETTLKLAKDAKYKVIGASDKAVILLSLAGAIEDKKVTGPIDSVSWLLKGKAHYINEPIYIDDKLVTIQNEYMSQKFASELLKILEK